MDRPQAGHMPPDAYEDHGGRVVAVITACSFVATAIVCLRFYVRLVIIKKFGADDWALAAALVCFLCPLWNHSTDSHLLDCNPNRGYHNGNG